MRGIDLHGVVVGRALYPGVHRGALRGGGLGHGGLYQPVQRRVGVGLGRCKTPLGMVEGKNKIMRVGVVAGPAAGEKRQFAVPRLLNVNRPVHAVQVHMEARVYGLYVPLQRLAGQLAHVVAGIIGEREPEPLVPDGPFVSLAEIFSGALAAELVAGDAGGVAGYPGRYRAFCPGGLALKPVVEVAVIVERAGESPAHVEVREKVGRDALAVQLAGAQVRVSRGADMEGEKEHRVRYQARQVVVDYYAFQPAHLRLVAARQVYDVGVAGLEHKLPGAEILHGLHYNAPQARGPAPVAPGGVQYGLLVTAVPASRHEGAGAVGGVEKPGTLRGAVAEVAQRFVGAVPFAPGDAPFLVHDVGPAGHDRKERGEGAP